MFESLEEARAALAAGFEPALVDAIVQALVPAIVLAPSKRADGLGGTRLGGTPDLPPGLDWPRPSPPPDPEAIARRGSEEAAASMRWHMALNPPFSFIGQIDLEAAAALGPVAAALPSEGRLLFFYDQAVGPWETGTRPARVIWDRAPRHALKATAMPADLAAAVEHERQETERGFVKYGLEMPDHVGSMYSAPLAPADLKAVYRLPNPHSLDMARLPTVARKPYPEMDESERRRYDDYVTLVEDHDDSFDRERWRRQQLLGSPMPEQDDPRYDAVAVADLGKQHLSSEEWTLHRADIEAKAQAWSLLLQIDFAEWTRADLVEGTVYFLIRTSDLANHHFDAVVAAYQQT